MNNKQKPFFTKYAAMAAQFMVAIAIAVYVGLQIDKALGFSNPFSIWLLPLLIITAIMVKIIRDTSTKK